TVVYFRIVIHKGSSLIGTAPSLFKLSNQKFCDMAEHSCPVDQAMCKNSNRTFIVADPFAFAMIIHDRAKLLSSPKAAGYFLWKLDSRPARQKRFLSSFGQCPPVAQEKPEGSFRHTALKSNSNVCPFDLLQTELRPVRSPLHRLCVGKWLCVHSGR